MRSPRPQACVCNRKAFKSGFIPKPQQKFAKAEPPLREWLQLRAKSLPDDWRTFNARSLLAAALSRQKRFDIAEPLLLEGYVGLKQREQRVLTIGRIRIREAGERLVQLYEALGKPDQAAEWKPKLKADLSP